jgi:hypothetical protein
VASPFPGIDPYIESQAWEDFHQGFIGELAAALVPQVRPRYVVRKELRIYVDHDNGSDRHIRGDLAIVDAQQDALPTPQHSESSVRTITPVIVSLPVPEEHREAFLTIRERESMQVVAVVELLSPSNKRTGEDGRREYLRKREEILLSDVHLVELDLLRGGQRLPTIELLPKGDYFAFVCRASRRYKAEVFAWDLRNPLPEIPIPLSADDPDVSIDLQAVFSSTFDRAGYDYSLDYGLDLAPELDDDETGWVRSAIESKGT